MCQKLTYLVFTAPLGDTIIIPTSQIGKLKLTEIRDLAQGHTAEWQRKKPQSGPVGALFTGLLPPQPVVASLPLTVAKGNLGVNAFSLIPTTTPSNARPL